MQLSSLKSAGSRPGLLCDPSLASLRSGWKDWYFSHRAVGWYQQPQVNVSSYYYHCHYLNHFYLSTQTAQPPNPGQGQWWSFWDVEQPHSFLTQVRKLPLLRALCALRMASSQASTRNSSIGKMAPRLGLFVQEVAQAQGPWTTSTRVVACSCSSGQNESPGQEEAGQQGSRNLCLEGRTRMWMCLA